MSESFDSLFARFSPDARLAVMSYAPRHMENMQHESIGAEHLLLGIMSANPGFGSVSPVNRMMVGHFGMSLYNVRSVVETKPRPVGIRLVNNLYTPSAVKALELAGAQAYKDRNRDGYITRFNIGFGIAKTKDPIVLSVLKDLNIELEAFTALMEESK